MLVFMIMIMFISVSMLFRGGLMNHEAGQEIACNDNPVIIDRMGKARPFQAFRGNAQRFEPASCLGHGGKGHDRILFSVNEKDGRLGTDFGFEARHIIKCP